MLSHRSAAAHWGLLASGQAVVDVTARRGRRGASGIRVHRARFLDARDTTTHEAIPITTVARTLLDLAATARPEQLERAFAHRANGHRARSSGAHNCQNRTSTAPSLPPDHDSCTAALIAAGHRVVRFTWRTPDPTIERRLRALLH